MSCAVIFGASGQDGHYLSQLLAESGVDCIGVARRDGPWLRADVADYGAVKSIVEKYQPAYIFHLAAESTTRHDALFANHAAIATGTINILECVRLHAPTARVFIAGSAMQFVNNGTPINELTPFEARSPYAIARIQATYAARYYRNVFGLATYVGFFFNHDSPLRSERHVNQKIVAAVARIAAGSTEKLELGDIGVQKEFAFAGDSMRAIWALINNDQISEAVIGTGEAHSIAEWVEYCFNAKNLLWRDHVVLRQTYQPEYSLLVSDPSSIMSLGWAPEKNFTALADLMLHSFEKAV